MLQAGATYAYGFAAIWYQWKNMLITPFYWLIAPWYRRSQRTTVAEIIEDRYGQTLGLVYTLFAILFFIFVQGVMLKGAGKAVAGATGGGIVSPNGVVVTMTVVFVLYSFVGGLVAAAYTNVIQGLLIVVLSFMLIPAGLMAVGGFSGMRDNLSADFFDLYNQQSGIGGFTILMLVINGLVTSSGLASLSFFEIARVGLPCALLGTACTIVLSRWLLPARGTLVSANLDPREYAVEMLVEPTSPIVGRSIEDAGLRHLPGAYLAEIERDGEVMPAVAPSARLRENDRLVFVGMVESVVDLVKTKGLIPAPEQLFKLDAPRQKRCLLEAVVSDRCPIVGRTIREGRFRSHYDAVVLAVARHGERVLGKIGDITLRAGDTLLLEGRPSFVQQHYGSRDFLLVSEVARSAPPSHERAWMAIGILGAMVAAVALAGIPMLKAGLLAAGLMVLTRCATSEQARRSIDWSLLTVIAAAMGLGKAMQVTGAAETIACLWMDLVGDDPWAALVAIYVLTSVFTAFLTNIAAAVLMFPIVLSTAASIQVSPYPFVIALMMAASTSLATPIGYQTNLMVYGPGAYRFVDYLRIGLPLNVILGSATILLIPIMWPF